MDDGLVLCKSSTILEKILSELGSTFEVTVGDSGYFYGMEIERNYEREEIRISQ